MPSLDSLKKLFNYRNIFAVTVFLLVSLTIINLICTNVLATRGFAVSEAETKTLKLEKENRRLSVKIEESVNLSGLEAMAKQNGFISSQNIVFVPTPPTFASR